MFQKRHSPPGNGKRNKLSKRKRNLLFSHLTSPASGDSETYVVSPIISSSTRRDSEARSAPPPAPGFRRGGDSFHPAARGSTVFCRAQARNSRFPHRAHPGRRMDNLLEDGSRWRTKEGSMSLASGEHIAAIPRSARRSSSPRRRPAQGRSQLTSAVTVLQRR